MDASEFNAIYDKKIVNRLVDIGFIRKGNNLFLIKGNMVLSLLRSSYRGLRVARFLLCVRHTFIRDMDKLKINEANLYLTNPNSYPFKLHPFQISKKSLSKWHYETNHVGINGYSYEEINYGECDFISNKIIDIEEKLDKLYLQVSTFGVEWMASLTPMEAVKQLRKFNSGDKIESYWISDYEDYLNSIC